MPIDEDVLKEAGIEKADALATCVSRFRNIGILCKSIDEEVSLLCIERPC